MHKIDSTNIDNESPIPKTDEWGNDSGVDFNLRLLCPLSVWNTSKRSTTFPIEADISRIIIGGLVSKKKSYFGHSQHSEFHERSTEVVAYSLSAFCMLQELQSFPVEFSKIRNY